MDGRSDRREYWLWVGPLLVAALIIVLAGYPYGVLLLGLPVFVLWIRRLHDMGLSGWIAPLINIGLMIVGFIFGGPTSQVGAMLSLTGRLIAIVVMGLIPGEPQSNAYGPGRSVKAVADTFS